MLFQSKTARRNIVLVCLAVFGVSMGGGVIRMFTASNVSAQAETVETTNETQLLDAEAGYKIVLQREPKNETALQGLLTARLARNGWSEAKETAETLLELFPNHEGYQAVLAEINDELSKTADVKPSSDPSIDVDAATPSTAIPSENP